MFFFFSLFYFIFCTPLNLIFNFFCDPKDAVGGYRSASLASFLILVLVGATMQLVVSGVQAWRGFLNFRTCRSNNVFGG